MPACSRKQRPVAKGLAASTERLKKSRRCWTVSRDSQSAWSAWRRRRSRQKEKQRLNGRDASVFGPSLGLGKAMDRQALDQTPPRDNLSGVPPAMYFGMMQRENANANVEMAQAPQPALPQHYVAPAISTATTWPRLCASA
ncbi:hypothetical protein PC128_g8162 [Phytophthora cactorum]|nr:hypothetical protein PC128_g8162 [Phytophthora cactorum]